MRFGNAVAQQRFLVNGRFGPLAMATSSPLQEHFNDRSLRIDADY